MEFTAVQIAEMLGGKVEGDPNAVVSKLSKIEEGQPGSLSFLANPKYSAHIYTTLASIVIVNADFVAEAPLPKGCTLIRVEDAYSCFAKLLEVYNKIKHDKKGVESPSFIDESAKLGEDVYVGAFSHIGKNVVIGKGVKIYPNCVIGDNAIIGDETLIYSGTQIYSESEVGKSCVIHAGVIIGSDGFGFAPNSENNYQKVAQIGNVIIEDHVEIGSNTCIDRATLGSTIIRKGVKLDNLIQIAHNVEIGENTVMAAQCGVAGSTKIGKNCMIGGQVGFAGHLNIGDGVKIAAQSGIGSNIEQDAIVQGSPAFSIGEYKRAYVNFRKLPDMNTRLTALEKLIKDINQIAEKNG
jgi:UDP-3-O-[3-hydroxymyristoyl] glucosamine N-acyltransferase